MCGMWVVGVGAWIKTYFLWMKQAQVHYDLLDSKEIKIDLDEDNKIYTSSSVVKKYAWDKIDNSKETSDSIVFLKDKFPLVTLAKAYLEEDALNYIREKSTNI